MRLRRDVVQLPSELQPHFTLSSVTDKWIAWTTGRRNQPTYLRIWYCREPTRYFVGSEPDYDDLPIAPAGSWLLQVGDDDDVQVIALEDLVSEVIAKQLTGDA